MGRHRQTSSASANPPTSAPGAPSASAATDRRFVVALARGLEVLRSFSPRDHWLPHHELTRRTGLPAATVSRLTYTLTHLGYLQHRPASGEYAISPAVLALGFSALSNFDLARIARPWMDDLAEATQSAVSLGVRHGTTMVYVAHCRSTARLSLGLDVGTRLPLAETAMGRAWWCSAAEPWRERVARLLEQEQPERWLSRYSRLRQMQDQMARRGYVTSEGEWESDIAAIGAGIDPGDGREPLALTLGGPATRLQGPLLHDTFGPLLVKTCRAIAQAVQTGQWRNPAPPGGAAYRGA